MWSAIVANEPGNKNTPVKKTNNDNNNNNNDNNNDNNNVNHNKENVTKEYYRRVRKILKSKLNGSNVINAINTRAVAIIRYGAGIIKWTKEELRNVDRKTRKLMNMHRALHPQADVDRLYIKRAEGGRGMISVEDCVEIETNSLHQYVVESKEKLLKAVKDEGILGEGMSKEDVAEKRRNQYKEKPLHGQYVRSTEEIRDHKSWNWLKRGTLKKETEGTLMAAPGGGGVTSIDG